MLFYRHGLLVRATHWINAVALTFMLMSGLQIFNARLELLNARLKRFLIQIRGIVLSDIDAHQAAGGIACNLAAEVSISNFEVGTLSSCAVDAREVELRRQLKV